MAGGSGDLGTQPVAAAHPKTQAPPRPAEGIELIGEYKGSGFKETPYLVKRADGQVVQLPKLLYLVAERIDGRRSYEDISEEVSEELQAGLGPEDVAYLVAEKLAPLGVAAGPEGTPGEIQSADPLLALRFKKAVVPKGLVRAVTSVFFPLFFLPILVGAVVGLAILDFWMFGSHGIAQSLRATIFDPSLLLALFGVVVVTAAFHECGHATGCRYGGAEPGVMGVGLYLVWPAFYTDLTDTYRLGKWGRLRADLGGVYFNTLFVLATAGLYFLTHFEPLLIVILLLQLEILVQFMPFLRMDGYYMVADVTGVPDLFARIGAIFKSLIPWREADPRVKELKTWVRVVVTAWVLIVVPVLLFNLAMIVISAPRIFSTAWTSLTSGSENLIAPVVVRPTSPLCTSR